MGTQAGCSGGGAAPEDGITRGSITASRYHGITVSRHHGITASRHHRERLLLGGGTHTGMRHWVQPAGAARRVCGEGVVPRVP
jgi:hypothetical protein